MRVKPRSLAASVFWLLLLPRGTVLMAWWGSNHLLQFPPAVVWVLIALDLTCVIWLARAQLRAADDHMVSSGAMAPIWGGYLLGLFFFLATLSFWWQAVLVANRPPPPEQSYAELRAQDFAARYRLTLSPDGSQLSLDGEITFGLTKALQAMLQTQPDLRLLTLTSPGGHIFEARGAARLIQARGLSTRTAGLCASACTLLFAAGDMRSLGPDGQLGFHSYALANFRGLPQIDLHAQEQKDRAFLITRGIDPGFIDQAFATPAQSLWLPSTAELSQAGVLRPNP